MIRRFNISWRDDDVGWNAEQIEILRDIHIEMATQSLLLQGLQDGQRDLRDLIIKEAVEDAYRQGLQDGHNPREALHL